MTVQIGNFKSVSTPEPQTSAPVQEAATQETPADTAMAALEEAVQTEALTPAEKYRKRLADAKIDIGFASRVFDDLLSKGYYERRSLIKGREAVFRTRTYEDHVRSVSAVEVASPKFTATQDELQSRYNLAASLVSWNGVTYKTAGGDPEREFAATMTAIKRLPAPIYALLLAELAQFDAQMFVIFSEGALENF